MQQQVSPLWSTSTVKKPHVNQPTQLNSFLERLHTLEIQDNGRPRLKLQANTLRQLANHTIYMLSPTIIMYNTANHLPWVIHADVGYTDTSGQLLHLKQHVILTQPSKQHGGHPRKLTTSELWIRPKASTAFTHQPVLITEADSQIHAVGLRANFKNDTITLLSNIKGETHVNAKD